MRAVDVRIGHDDDARITQFVRLKSIPIPQPSAVISVATPDRREHLIEAPAFSTLILPFSGRIVLFCGYAPASQSRPRSPFTPYSSESAGSRSRQVRQLPFIGPLSRAPTAGHFTRDAPLHWARHRYILANHEFFASVRFLPAGILPQSCLICRLNRRFRIEETSCLWSGRRISSGTFHGNDRNQAHAHRHLALTLAFTFPSTSRRSGTGHRRARKSPLCEYRRHAECCW